MPFGPRKPSGSGWPRGLTGKPAAPRTTEPEDQFGSLQASLLYCPRCREAQTTRERSLLELQYSHARTVAAVASDRQPVRVPLPAMWNLDGIQDRTGARRDAASVEHPYSPASQVLGTGARGPGREGYLLRSASRGYLHGLGTEFFGRL